MPTLAWTMWISLGAAFAGLGVVLGAFGAHALREKFTPEAMNIFEIGVRYQMYHAFGVIFCGMVATRIDSGLIRGAAGCFSVGILVFSGSLYGLAFSGIRWLGAVTPVGGVLFIVGWVLLAISVQQTASLP